MVQNFLHFCCLWMGAVIFELMRAALFQVLVFFARLTQGLINECDINLNCWSLWTKPAIVCMEWFVRISLGLSSARCCALQVCVLTQTGTPQTARCTLVFDGALIHHLHIKTGYLASGNSDVKGSHLSTCTPQEAKHQGKLVELLVNTCQPLSQGRTWQMRGGIRGSHISSEVWGQKSVLASFLCNFRRVEWSWLTHLIWCVTFFFCITSLVDSVLVLLLWSPLSLTVFSITT